MKKWACTLFCLYLSTSFLAASTDPNSVTSQDKGIQLFEGTAILHIGVAIGVCLLLFLTIQFARKVRTKWPFVTILLYTIFFVLLVLPLLWGVFAWLGDSDSDIGDWSELPEIYGYLYGQVNVWPFWLIFAGMILSQACLLIIPVRTSHERPKPRRGIWLTAIAAAFLYTVLLFGTLISLESAVWGDKSPDCPGWLLWVVLPANWILWLVIFRLFANRLDPQSYVCRIVKWLMRGSILELLVAVPSHIIVRHKDTCCAHMVTAIGIAAGLAVMLFAFGPGLYYLYWDRINRRKPKVTAKSQQSEPQDPPRAE